MRTCRVGKAYPSAPSQGFTDIGIEYGPPDVRDSNGSGLLFELALIELQTNMYPKPEKPPANCCSMCDKPGNLLCRVCMTRYCSKECQTADWPQHILLCKDFRSLPQLPQRGKHYLTIVFPADTSKPKLVWSNGRVGAS